MKKLNSNGQTLVLFIIFIPIIIILGAFTVNLSYKRYYYNKLSSINKTVLIYAINNSENINKELIIDKVYKNDDSISSVISIENDIITLSLSKNVNTLYSNFFKDDMFKIKVTYKANIKDKKVERVE